MKLSCTRLGLVLAQHAVTMNLDFPAQGFGEALEGLTCWLEVALSFRRRRRRPRYWALDRAPSPETPARTRDSATGPDTDGIGIGRIVAKSHYNLPPRGVADRLAPRA